MSAKDDIELEPKNPRKRGNAMKKKRRNVIESKAAQWVADNVKTKKKINEGVTSQDVAEGESEQIIDVKTRGFGVVDFKGATRRAKAKFVQIADDTPADLIFTLITKVWKLETPQLLISVTGGAKIFNMEPRLKEMFATGLRKVAQTPGTWVVTGGTSTGVMKHVGEALQGASKALIGIATWGIVANRKSLRAAVADIPLGGVFPYNVQSSLVAKGAFLDHNHTHFILVHDGSQNKYGVEIPFRSRFEKFIMESAERVPSVLLVLEGGPNTLHTVLGACGGDSGETIPVVVIKGSGRAADVLSYAYSLEENLSMEQEYQHDGLRRMIIQMFPELKTEEKQWDIYLKIVECMEKKNNITIFQMTGDADVDEAILAAVLKSHQTSPMLQLKLTLLWNRADLAEDLILSKIKNWDETDLQNAMIMALALDRLDFVRLFLKNCVSINTFLTKNLLEFLYGYRSKMMTSSLRFEINEKEYTAMDSGSTHAEILKTLCGYENYNTASCSLPYSVIKRSVRQLCNKLINQGTEGFLEDLSVYNYDDESKCTFEYPYRELFFWAVLNNMHEMALFLWELGEEGIAKAIIASEINNVLAENADKNDLPEELRKSFVSNSQDFKDIALNVLDNCYAVNESKTERLITSELNQFPGNTCLSLASASKQEEFIAHSSVQQLLNDVWTGAIKTREISGRAIVSAIFFPPLIGSFDFRNVDELKKMATCEQLDSDDEFDLNEETPNLDDVPSKVTSTTEETNGSSLQLIDSTKQIQSYDSIQVDSTDHHHDTELHWFKKLIEFYFRIPIVKFYTNLISYFIFLGLFSYIAMLKKNDTTPSNAEIVLIVFVASLGLEELHQIFQSDANSLKSKFKEYFSSIWNIMDVIAITIFFVALGLRLHPDMVQYGHLMYAIDSWFWILRLLRYFYVHRILGPYVLIIGKMFIDMLYFISILVVFLVAYGVLTKAILTPQPTSYLMLRDAIFHPYFNIYGELFVDRDESPGVTRFGTPTINEYAEPITWIFLGIYLLIANVLLLNLLIAIFGNTFSAVQEKSDQIWKFERYDLVIEYFNRPSLVPPFIILEHIWLLVRWVYQKCQQCCAKKSNLSANKLQTALNDMEIEELIEFQMEVISNLLRSKKIETPTDEIMKRIDGLSSDLKRLDEQVCGNK